MTGALVQKRYFQLIAARGVYFLFRFGVGGDFSYVLQPYLAVNYGMPRLHKF